MVESKPNNEKERQDLIGAMENQFRDLLEPFVGQVLADETLESFKNTIVKNIPKNVRINHEIHVQTLWQSWSRWYKLVWWFLNITGIRKLFKARYQKRRLQSLSGCAAALVEQEYQKETNDQVLDAARVYWDEQNKWWYESDPKTIIIANFSITPPVPLEYIELTFNIDERTEEDDQ